jgi:hypothetical protein
VEEPKKVEEAKKVEESKNVESKKVVNETSTLSFSWDMTTPHASRFTIQGSTATMINCGKWLK